MRDFEWTGSSVWELHCNACGAYYWKFKGINNPLHLLEIKKEISYKAGDKPTRYERDKMTNTFDGRIVCPDCGHYPLCGSPASSVGVYNISCTKCGSQFDYSYENTLDIVRTTDRMPHETAQICASEPEPDEGFLLGGSL